jgi:hypothetical protein
MLIETETAETIKYKNKNRSSVWAIDFSHWTGFIDDVRTILFELIKIRKNSRHMRCHIKSRSHHKRLTWRWWWSRESKNSSDVMKLPAMSMSRLNGWLYATSLQLRDNVFPLLLLQINRKIDCGQWDGEKEREREMSCKSRSINLYFSTFTFIWIYNISRFLRSGRALSWVKFVCHSRRQSEY